MPPQITCASALPDKTAKHESCILHSLLYQCIARIQAVAALFLQSFWLTTHNHAAVWLPESCNQCVQLRALGEHKAPVRCLLGFLFCKVMLKHQKGEVGKQSIIWFLISYFLSNTCAKNYRNQVVCVKIIASQMWDVLRHRLYWFTAKWPLFS